MSDKRNILPFVIAIIGHAALIALLLWNFEFDKTTIKHQYVDAPVTAKLVTAPEKSKKDAQSLKRKQQLEADRKRIERQKEAKRQEELKQKERDKKAAQEKAEQEKKKVEQQKKKQIEDQQRKAKELEQQKIKQEADRKKKIEADKKRKAEEAKKKKLEAEKKRKAEAERKRKEAERKKQQEIAELEASLDDELFEADLGDVRQTQIMGEVERIQVLIKAKIKRYWNKPKAPGECKVEIKTGPGGVVLSTKALSGDDEYCQSGILAIQKAEPLPYSDDPDVAVQLKDISFTFDLTEEN